MLLGLNYNIKYAIQKPLINYTEAKIYFLLIQLKHLKLDASVGVASFLTWN